MRNKYFITLGLAVILIFALFGLRSGQKAPEPEAGGRAKPSLLANFVTPVFVATLEEENLIPRRNWQIPDLDMGAQSALAVSFDGNRTYFSKNAQLRLPMASLTKLMTALIVLENYNLDEILTIPAEAVRREGEKGDLRPAEKITVRSLLSIMLIDSSNDAAVVLARNSSNSFSDFVGLMNKRALDLGLQNTHFDNPDGLDGATHYSTALDLANLFRYLSGHYPDALKILGTQNMVVYSADGKIAHRLKNSNDLLGKIPEVIAGKTGFTDNARGCLALFVGGLGEVDNGAITIILGSEDRFGDSEKLINWLRSAYIWK